MIKKLLALTTATLIMASQSSFAQSDNAAEERARLANQRIQAEAERQAELERERAERLANTRVQNNNVRAENNPQPRPSAAVPIQRARSKADLSLVLQQLRELGELKDAGYLSDDEFSALKRRILGHTP